MIESLVVGRNPRETARRVRKEFSIGLSRALRISRTETLRAYREATREVYRANSDIVRGWIWVAAKSARTCPACLAMDGTFHRLDEGLDDHPNNRCAMVPAVKGMDMPKRETGAEWFDKQDEAIQRKILGNAGFEAYKAGAVKLSDFVGHRRSRDWGTTRYARSLTQILGTEEAKKWTTIAFAAMAEKNEPSILRFDVVESQRLGNLAVLQHLYPKDEPGREFLRPLPVVVNNWVLNHIKQDHPERIKWLLSHGKDIKRAVSDPEIVERKLSYRDRIGHWFVTTVISDSQEKQRYMAIVLSLAGLSGEEFEFHQVVTVYPMKHRDLFSGKALKERWIHVKETKN